MQHKDPFIQLDTSSAKSFRKSLLEVWAKLLKQIREADESITEKEIWAQLQALKGELFEKNPDISKLIQIAKQIKISGTQPVDLLMQQLVANFIAIENNQNYQQFLNKPVVTTAKTPGKQFTIFQPSPIALKQIQNLEDKANPNKEMVELLMEIAAPADYNGHLIDFDEYTSKVDPESLNTISDRTQRLAALDEKYNALLAEQIDQLIEDAVRNNKNRVHIVLKSGVHYTAADIDINSKHLIIMDAAQHLRSKRLYEVSRYSKYIKPGQITTAQNQGYDVDNEKFYGAVVQKAEFGCSIFTLAHSFAMARRPDFHADVRTNMVRRDDNLNMVDWVKLPPDFVAMSQSTTFVAHYNTVNPQYRGTMNQLTQNNKRNAGFLNQVQTFEEKITQHNTKKNQPL